MKHIIISHGRTPTAPRLSSTWAFLRIVCLGDGNDLLFHLLRIIPPPASDSRCRGVRGEGPPLQGYILRNAARICSQVGEGTQMCARAHTHTRFNTYSTIHTGGRVGLGTRRFAPTFFPEAHASWWQFKTLYLRSLIFFPKSKTLLGWHLLHMQPGGNESCKNENQAISYRAWEGQGRGTWLLRLAMFSLRVPSASSNSASDWLIPAPPGSYSRHPKSISWAINLPRLPQLRGAAFPDLAFWEKPEFHFYSSSLGPQWSWLILRINCLINEGDSHSIFAFSEVVRYLWKGLMSIKFQCSY